MSDERTILRSVFLPPALDDRLRVFAHEHGVKKSDVILTAIKVYLEQMDVGKA